MLIRGNVHTPIFDFDNNEITISENTPLNTEIISLAAIDNDEGPDGEVLYVIADGEKQKFGIFLRTMLWYLSGRNRVKRLPCFLILQLGFRCLA